MRKLSVVIAGRHSTSICLEDEFLNLFKKIAATKNMSINQLVTEIDANRTTENLSSAIRIYVLKFVTKIPLN
ncbi:MAG: ribbon-helix-helix domain-containing protein [Alphaproteobacteria bacterium]|nr:aryl-sulfate sulfotransferase [Alphaproteobacteria bacterium]MBQ7285344.1 ribbon-helix-helix domain-containing protein [Alphaproteobacteria bacterium]